MGKILNLFKSKVEKAEAIRNPWGLANYLSEKHGGKPAKYAAAIEDKKNQEGSKANPVAGGDVSSVRSRTTRKLKGRTKSGATDRRTKSKVTAKTGRARAAAAMRKKSSDSVTQFVNFLSEGNISALNKMAFKVDDSPEGLFMQAVRKAMGIHSEQYKDVGKPQFLKKAAKAEPLQKLHPRLAAFLAGLAIDVFDDVGQMTPAQARNWERTVNRQMTKKSLKDGVSMQDLQKHWSDSSDTYFRRIPVSKGVQADETFLDKKLASPPRAGEVWNPVSHRWTKDGNLGKVNVGSGGRKRLRAGSNAAGAHQRSVGGLSGKGRLRHIGTGRQYRSKLDIAEQAQGTSVGVGSAKGPSSRFRTGAKSAITSKKPSGKTGSGSLKRTPTRKRTRKGSSGKHSNLNVRQVANTGRR
tara:strand:+ start:4892 stop:6121 length:1230 start_codon:yes stop_codon:yes gene_type:complete